MQPLPAGKAEAGTAAMEVPRGDPRAALGAAVLSAWLSSCPESTHVCRGGFPRGDAT